MNYQYIEQLLERYWECETTLEEEQILRSFFSQPELPEHLKQYAQFFVYEAKQKQDGLGEDFEKRILEMVGDESSVDAKKISLSSRLTSLFKAAAVIAIVLTIGNVAERTLQVNSTYAPEVGPADTYTKKEDITAKIKIIDHTKSDAMAKTDSLKNQAPSLNSDETMLE